MHKDLRLKKHTCVFILALLVLLLGEIFYQVCFAAPEATPVEVGRPSIFSDNPNPLVCIDGNTVTLEFTVSKSAAGDDAEVTGQIQIAGDRLDLVKKEEGDHYIYSTAKEITGLDDGTEISCDVSQVKINQVGFEEQLLKNPLDKIRFYQDLTVSDFKFISTHGDNSLIDGNQAVFSFLTNHPVIIDGEIKIGGQSVTMVQQQTSKGYSYTGGVTMSSQFNDNTVIKVDTATVRIKDDYGNPSQGIVAPSNALTYFAPLIADQTVKNFALNTTNVGQTDDGIRLVKQGDLITVQFETTHAVTITKALIGGQEVTVSAKDGKHWSGVYTVGNLVDNENIPIEIILDDGLGNPAFTITEKHFEPVRYYVDIEINHLLFESNNSQSLALAKNDDDINLTFTTNHPTVISKATIAGKPVACTSQDGVHFTATYAIDGHEGDQAALSYEIVVSDKAGNDSITRGSNQFITYYAPIQVTDLSMISTNARDGSRYCKDGDNIVLFFKTNHTSDVAATINGKNPTIDNGFSGFTLVAPIANGDIKDQGMASFDFVVSDVAGNQTHSFTQGDVQNQIVYFAPITATTQVTGSGGKTPGYIKNGSTISAVTSANHEAQYTNVDFQGRDINASGLSASYTIPYDEVILSEGPITYNLAIDDKAGNTLVQSGAESIIYDRTNPAIKIEPNVAGFTNSNLDMTVTYEDANLDAGDMVMAVNGANRLADGRSPGTSYSQKVSLTGEEEYMIAATATDKAGNTATGNTAKVIIDKTNPKIVAIDVDINQVPVYKAGFKLSDHFKIEEKYLRSISCTLAQRSGLGHAKAWELDKAIHDEGLMTAQIISEDMANNTSDTLKYSFYVDGTAPKPILRVGNKTLNNERVEEIGNTATLDIGLDRIEMGDEKPDRYTRLEIQDQDGKVIKNLMGNQKEMTSATYPLNGNGKFQIIIEARDDVGNNMAATYWVQLSNDGALSASTTNNNVVSPWWFILAAVCLLILCFLIILIVKKRKKKTS